MPLTDELRQLLESLMDVERAEADTEARFDLFLASDRTRRLKVKMYQEGHHARPHVHIDYGRDKPHLASYSIDGNRLAGTLDTKMDRAIREWLDRNRDHLMIIWDQLRAGESPVIELGEVAGWH